MHENVSPKNPGERQIPRGMLVYIPINAILGHILGLVSVNVTNCALLSDVLRIGGLSNLNVIEVGGKAVLVRFVRRFRATVLVRS